MRNDDGRVERGKVQHDERAFVERRLRFHDERLAFGGVLTSDLMIERV